MTTIDFITTLFCCVDDRMSGIAKHAQALLYPSELVTIGILYALKGCGERPFYRWLTRDYRPLFPRLPDRMRLFWALTAHRAWTDYFLAEPSLLGMADSRGIELIHPRREGRRSRPLGDKRILTRAYTIVIPSLARTIVRGAGNGVGLGTGVHVGRGTAVGGCVAVGETVVVDG